MKPNEHPASSVASRAEYQGRWFSTKSAYGRLSACVPSQNTARVTSRLCRYAGRWACAVKKVQPSHGSHGFPSCHKQDDQDHNGDPNAPRPHLLPEPHALRTAAMSARDCR